MIASLAERFKNTIFGRKGDADAHKTRTQITRKRSLNDGNFLGESVAKRSRIEHPGVPTSPPFITGMPTFLQKLFHRHGKDNHHGNIHGNGHATGLSRPLDDPIMARPKRPVRPFDQRSNHLGPAPPSIFHRQPYSPSLASSNHITASQSHDSVITSQPTTHHTKPLYSNNGHKPDFRPQLYTPRARPPISMNPPPANMTPLDKRQTQAKYSSMYEKTFMRSDSRSSSCLSNNSTLQNKKRKKYVPPPANMTPLHKRQTQAKYSSMYEKTFMRSDSHSSSCLSNNSTLQNQINSSDKRKYIELLRQCHQNDFHKLRQPQETRVCVPGAESVIVIDDTKTPSPTVDLTQPFPVIDLTHPHGRREHKRRSGVATRDVSLKTQNDLSAVNQEGNKSHAQGHAAESSRGAIWDRLGPAVDQSSAAKTAHRDAVLRVHPQPPTIIDPKRRPSSDTSLSSTATRRNIERQTSQSVIDLTEKPPQIEDHQFIHNLQEKYNLQRRQLHRDISENLETLKIDDKQRKLFQQRDTLLLSRQRLRVARKEAPPLEDVYISSEESEEEDEEEVIEEIVVETLPVLTEEMEAEISRALVQNPGGQVLAEGYRMQITRANMHSLHNLNWLNDEIINFYMNMLMARGGQNGYARSHCFNTFFYEKLKTDGYNGVRRWTKKADIFACEFVVVPVHMGLHWCLATIDLKSKSITYYDSLRGKNDHCLNLLRQYLDQESKDKKKIEFDYTGWTSCCATDIPEQMNGSDCGVFACKYAEYITRNAPITFTQANMAYFRRRMVYEILHNKLL